MEKIRQFEAKYPVINTSTENVINTLNEKVKPVRNVINTVKDTTTSTIQQGKDKVIKTNCFFFRLNFIVYFYV